VGSRAAQMGYSPRSETPCHFGIPPARRL